MSVGWTIVFIIMLIIIGSSLYSGTHSVAGAFFMILFMPLLIVGGAFTVYAGYKAVASGPRIENYGSRGVYVR
jgi:hypothetical protein